MIKRNGLYLLFFIFFMTTNVSAQTQLVLNGHERTILDDTYLWSSTNTQGTPNSFKVLLERFNTAKPILSTLGGMGAYVSKIDVNNMSDKERSLFVNLSANYLDVGSAYWQPKLGEAYNLGEFGYIGGIGPKLAHSQVVPLSLKPNEAGTLWIYIEAKKFTTPVSVSIYSSDAFYRKQFIINSLTTISFSVMLTLGLIACFIYLRTHYLVTLACAGYIGLHGLGWFAASGSLGNLYPFLTFNPVYAGIMIFPFAIASACQFTKLLFNCHKEHIKLAKLLNWFSLVGVVLGVLMPFLSFNHSYLISHLIAAAWVPLCIGIGVLMLKNMDYRAKYYLIGNLLYGLSLTAYVLSHIFDLSWGFSLELIVLVALTVDCICILLSLTEWMQIQQKEYRRSHIVSRIDPLTQIGNRYAQNEKLSNLKGDYCLVFIDLDGFKEINDKFGHEKGDQFLVATVDLIQQQLQGLGTVFRSGGDEFILVVDNKTSHQIPSIVEQIKTALLRAEEALRLTQYEHIGLSFGIASSLEAANQSECLLVADQRMYKHKQAKRERVEV